MARPEPNEQSLIDKIRSLPPEKLAEVEDFVDSLRQRAEDRELAQAFTRISEPAFQRVWDNPDDADYDKL
jgi:hypothetical protein